MTYPGDTKEHQVYVHVVNTSDMIAKPPYVKNTTFKTYVLDPAGGVGPKNIEIASYEANRCRLAIQTMDGAIAVTLDNPSNNSPDTNSPNAAVTGLYLPASTALVHEFFGPDAMWINSLSAITRVSIIKEYH